MNPTPGDVHVDSMLTDVSVAYIQSQDQFIADRVFPTVNVQHQSDLYRVYDMADWLRDEAQERAPATVSVGDGWRMSQASYYARVYALHKDLDDQTLANADPELDLEGDSVRFVTQKLLLRKERLFIASAFGGSIWTGLETGVAAAPGANQFLQWNDAASTPIEDIEARRVIMEQLTGFTPNTLVLGPQVLSALKNHPDIMDRIKYTQTGQITLGLLASLFEVDRIFVPRAIYNTAAEGATASYTYLYGKSALLVYAAPNPGLLMPSGGYTFAWNGLTGAGQGTRIKNFRMESIASTRIEGEMAFDMKIVGADLGTYWASAVA